MSGHCWSWECNCFIELSSVPGKTVSHSHKKSEARKPKRGNGLWGDPGDTQHLADRHETHNSKLPSWLRTKGGQSGRDEGDLKGVTSQETCYSHTAFLRSIDGQAWNLSLPGNSRQVLISAVIGTVSGRSPCSLGLWEFSEAFIELCNLSLGDPCHDSCLGDVRTGLSDPIFITIN